MSAKKTERKSKKVNRVKIPQSKRILTMEGRKRLERK